MGGTSFVRSCALLGFLAISGFVALAQPSREVTQPDGTVIINDLAVPLSDLLSPEARAYMKTFIVRPPFSGARRSTDIKEQRAAQDKQLNGFLEPMRSRYPVNIEHQTIAGIYTDVVTPKEGVSARNKNKVLLNVHGGGFLTGARTSGLVESVPIASIEKIKVITIDYRMGPEYKFPAASEDVAAVYKEVLKKYRPKHIGLYGCSAGGMLSGMSVAWFQAHNLPNPAAIGVLCAGLSDMFVGDIGYLGGPLSGFPRSSSVGNSAVKVPRVGAEYLSGIDMKDPLVYPINSPELLAKFPPTLFVTSTRGFEFGSAIDSANALTRAGVEAELHVWDGLIHAFWYNSDLPESREVYSVIAKFFDKHLSD
jgi:epsilon-lactone hydrolase